MRGELIKGHLDLLLLSVLADEPRHGYAVIEELRARSDEAFDLPEGTIYPALHRLENEGLLASRWDASTGRKRRVYQVTRQGRKALVARKEEWSGFASAVGGVIGATS